MRHAHRPLRRHREARRRVLLELRGDVRRRRLLATLLLRDLVDHEFRLLQVLDDAVRVFLRLEGRPRADLLEPLAVPADERRGEARSIGRLERCLDEPVVDRNERLDLLLAIDDQPKRRGLHATRREPEGELAPEKAGEWIAPDAVEDAAGALRLVEVLVERAGMLEPLVDALLRDLVEEDPLDLDLLVRLLHLLHEVVGDGLTLAVGVGGEEDLLDLLGLLADVLDDLALALLFEDFVGLLEPVFDVDAAPLRQILDVPLGGNDVVVLAQVLLDGLGLGRGFDDEQRLRHLLPY